MAEIRYIAAATKDEKQPKHVTIKTVVGSALNHNRPITVKAVVPDNIIVAKPH